MLLIFIYLILFTSRFNATLFPTITKSSSEISSAPFIGLPYLFSRLMEQPKFKAFLLEKSRINRRFLSAVLLIRALFCPDFYEKIQLEPYADWDYNYLVMHSLLKKGQILYDSRGRSFCSPLTGFMIGRFENTRDVYLINPVSKEGEVDTTLIRFRLLHLFGIDKDTLNSIEVKACLSCVRIRSEYNGLNWLISPTPIENRFLEKMRAFYTRAAYYLTFRLKAEMFPMEEMKNSIMKLGKNTHTATFHEIFPFKMSVNSLHTCLFTCNLWEFVKPREIMGIIHPTEDNCRKNGLFLWNRQIIYRYQTFEDTFLFMIWMKPNREQFYRENSKASTQINGLAIAIKNVNSFPICVFVDDLQKMLDALDKSKVKQIRNQEEASNMYGRLFKKDQISS